MEKWQTKKDTTAEEIAQWEKLWPTARNTGILTQHTPALDIDILNQEAAKGVEELARERFGERGCFLVRIGLAPKRIVLLRTDKPFEKISANLIAPNGDTKQKIEVLADGQQAIVFGTHPETRNPYSWHGGQPGEIACEELPHVSEHEARQFVADAVALLVEPFGYREAASRPKKNGNGLEHADADWAYLVSNIRQGRELHDTLRDLAAKLVTSGMTEGAAINFLRALMHECEAPHDARWRERYDDIARVVEGTVQWKERPTREKAPSAPPPLPFVNMSNWDNETIPQQEWAVPNRIPLRQTVLFSGEGAAGKSTAQLHLSAAYVLGRDWLGSMPEPGPAIFVDAEDDQTVMHRRLAHIADHYQVTFADLINGGLHLISLVGEDAVLAAASRSGKIEPTPRYQQLLEAAGDIKPKMVGRRIESPAVQRSGNPN